MSKRYTEAPKVKSICKVCGDNKVHHVAGKGGKKRQEKNYPIPYYFKAFEKTGWFRGDDEYLGRICRACINAGKVEQL